MSIFKGLAGPRYEPSGRIDVSIELLLGYVMIRASHGAWLGTWPAVNVSATKLDDSLVKLLLEDEEILFECAQSVQFLKELQVQSAYFRSMSGWRRSSRRARLYLERFQKIRRPEGRPSVDSPEDSQTHQGKPQRYLPRKNHAIAHLDDEDSLHAKFYSAQEDVIRSIAAAMISWFGYYFALGKGTPRRRLLNASKGLKDGAEGLRLVGGILEDLTSVYDDKDARLRMYHVAVAGWADAFEKISAAARLDQRSLAREGFARLDEASAIAETVVLQRSSLGQHPSLSLELSTLHQFQPPKSVSKKAVERAKAPWRRALRAAGARLDWTNPSY